ncbi:site-specific DNA-methyltransferase [Rhodobacter capsulatus]|jgi:adenine-specific DNA-methyltransferase|uniref:site-specific DNA-methyltransferase (adenine-specific) n=1 Tax=Rhodobacter capsulatus (strain ATCC BAA-309 / NBRC 16581 / SB1003) TaxID=272942 RepID=D5ASC6_RHOCB|nr:site-specific DNA-methyltransferase [Rhodobacter capsulatus]ADE85017.1 type III restriction-modification system RcaSBIIP, Mod subunit [Rhodobacter capsulatus SB 1003]ETD02062.1 DNA methylase [Rhodobacter capsulatus DE442]ETD77736.1 DNA methylase [Rhodobacter capsulatus R121]ETE54094.1 DNA methylase [Rhodobacter capsulatus Y262]MDS0926672.1 site-specific DNA-methyltransferase [Rhodobacter capsulatus]
MTELVFKGKEFVWNHHLAVPFRPLVVQAEKGIGEARLDGNLIIQGDNLHALKALMPMYAGKVDCIFIDPPYNTGNEGWAYNDNVNAPMIKEWLNSNPIGIEDGLRHDKWCAMMWPRLRLLHELLAEWGSIWITLDDNEAHRAKILLDEIFGEDAFVANMVWQKRYVANVTALHLSDMHDHVLVYAKNPSEFALGKIGRTEAQAADYKNPDNDPRGPWRAQDLSASKQYQAGIFTITGPDGATFDPPPNRYWRMNRAQYDKWLAEGRISFGVTGKGRPMLKRFLTEAQDGLTPVTWWSHDFAGHNKEATLEMKDIFDGASPFDTPKPKRLISRILELIGDDDALVLDSFAGSGTTAHAVLEANKRDGGSRRFILCEMEDYADRLTAERVRRVINGYAFTGTQKTELARERLNWRSIEKAADLVHKVQAIENLHGHEYDRIKKEVKDGELVVTGEKAVSEQAEGLGGTFTYCTLGDPVELDRILTGEDLPTFEALGPVLYHMATAEVADPAVLNAVDFYLGEASAYILWLIYKPDLEWLKSADAALTLSFARGIHELRPDKKHLVFAPARHVSQRMLDSEGLGVEFAPLPFALYRVERG